jgi:hypothetical protein
MGLSRVVMGLLYLLTLPNVVQTNPAVSRMNTATSLVPLMYPRALQATADKPHAPISLCKIQLPQLANNSHVFNGTVFIPPHPKQLEIVPRHSSPFLYETF